MEGASLRISTLCLVLVILAGAHSAFAEDGAEGLTSLDDEPVAEIASPAGEEIEAKAYDVVTIRPSKSGRVYLFQKDEADMPPPGKLFLLRDGTTPVMALRVLKAYPELKRVAAKKLRAYPTFDPLGRGSRFRAFEKVGDILSDIPPSPEDLSDIRELESTPGETAPAMTEQALETDPPQPEPLADQPPVPPSEPVVDEPAENPNSPEKLYTSQDDALEVKEIEEEDELDHYFPNQFTMEVGFLPSPNVPGPSTKFGGGLRYGRKISRNWMIEAGTYYYKAATTDGIALTVLPVLGTLQWQTKMSEIWTGYLYGGFIYPYVATTVGATKRQLALIQTISPAFGAGVYLQTGPNWYLRANLGVELISFGVMLRY